jgi:hypothetical protein
MDTRTLSYQGIGCQIEIKKLGFLVPKMEDSDCQTHPFPLVYNLYISGLSNVYYFLFIAAYAIYFLRVYVYIICNFE